MTFETTSSNTGHVSVGCISIQQATGKALLWTVCRYHVGEIIWRHVFNDLDIETKITNYSSFCSVLKYYKSLEQNELHVY